MSGDRVTGIVDDLKRWLQENRLNVIAERPLPHGHQIQIGDGAAESWVNIYTTGTVNVQGKKSSLKERLREFTAGQGTSDRPLGRGSARIGLDESGKGDYFGPLVIAAVYADSETEGPLEAMGVKDSKRLSDESIENIAEELRAAVPNAVISIGPRRYNDLMKKIGNLNRLLAWGHARALENLLVRAECPLAIADQFGDERFLQEALMKKGRSITLLQRPRAEEDLAVAAASVLARHEFVRRMELLSRTVGMDLPKGASQAVVQAARDIVARHGREALSSVAKLHFKTTKSVLAQT